MLFTHSCHLAPRLIGQRHKCLLIHFLSCGLPHLERKQSFSPNTVLSLMKENKAADIFLFKKSFYWSIVDLQYFRCAAKWLMNTDVHTHIFICKYVLFQNTFYNRSLQDIEYSLLCYTVDPCWLSILYSRVYLLIPNSIFILPHHFPFGNHTFIFYVCKSISIL